MKDLVYEIYQENEEMISSKQIEITDRFKSEIFRETRQELNKLYSLIEHTISISYPEIKKARITLELE